MKAIVTKYHGPTDTKGLRLSASDEDGNKVFIPYPHEFSGPDAHWQAAKALIKKMDWWRDGCKMHCGSLKNGYVFVFELAHHYEIDPDQE